MARSAENSVARADAGTGDGGRVPRTTNNAKEATRRTAVHRRACMRRKHTASFIYAFTYPSSRLPCMSRLLRALAFLAIAPVVLSAQPRGSQAPRRPVADPFR